jgi:hypothetical protein
MRSTTRATPVAVHFDEVPRDLLVKHHRPVGFKTQLRESATVAEAVDSFDAEQSPSRAAGASPIKTGARRKARQR